MEDDDLSWMAVEDCTAVSDVRLSTVNKKRSKLIMLDDLLRERERKRNQPNKSHLTFEQDDCSSGTDDDGIADKKVQMVKKMLNDLESESTSVEEKDSSPLCRLDWFPTFTEIMDVFHSYGYRKALVMKDGKSSHRTVRSCQGELIVCDPPSGSGQLEGPPPNIRSFLAFLISLLQTRHLHQTLSASDAEELAVTLAHCQMDRRIESIFPMFRSCLKALVHYFTEEEWTKSFPRIASSFSSMSLSFLNQVRTAKRLNGGDTRICSLQQSVVVLLLEKSVKRDMKNAADVVSIFKPINTKIKNFDFLNLFHQLTSADMYLWSEVEFERNGSVHKDWLAFLKRITLNISSSDERPHATKARNWASFLYQKYQF